MSAQQPGTYFIKENKLVFIATIPQNPERGPRYNKISKATWSLKMMVINAVSHGQEQEGEKKTANVHQFCTKLILISVVTGSQLAACLGTVRCQSFMEQIEICKS